MQLESKYFFKYEQNYRQFFTFINKEDNILMLSINYMFYLIAVCVTLYTLHALLNSNILIQHTRHFSNSSKAIHDNPKHLMNLKRKATQQAN